MMQEYETNSGQFDSNGNIEAGREVYYYFKGLYYQKQMQLDSAEHYMRRLLTCNQEMNGYRGLLNIYSLLEVPDSVVRFAHLFERASDERYMLRETEVIHQMTALFDYSQSERIAHEKTFKAERLQLYIMGLSFLFLFIMAAMIALFRIEKSKRREAVEQYLRNVAQLRDVRKELEVLREVHNVTSLVAKKEGEKDDLEKEVLKYQQSIAVADIDPSRESTVIGTTEICRHFRVLANRGQRPTEDDWQELEHAFKRYLPETYTFINAHRHLMDETNLHVCFLVRMGIKPTPISHMLGVTDAYISLIRKELLRKLYGTTGKPKEFDAAILKLN